MPERIFKDFNTIIPEERIAKIADKEIDVSVIPARITLEVAKFRDTILKMGFEAQLNKSYEIVERICRVSDPDFSIDEIIDKVNFEQLQGFLEFVMEPLNRPASGKKKVKKKKK